MPRYQKTQWFCDQCGNATAADVMQLIRGVADKVKEQFGVTIGTGSKTIIGRKI